MARTLYCDARGLLDLEATAFHKHDKAEEAAAELAKMVRDMVNPDVSLTLEQRRRLGQFFTDYRASIRGSHGNCFNGAEQFLQAAQIAGWLNSLKN